MTDHASSTPQPRHDRIHSRTGLEEAIDTVLPLARRRIAVFARSLGAEWNQDSRVDVLRRFCLESRRNQARILVHDPQPAYLKCPRLLGLLRQFGHVVAIHETSLQAKGVYDPFVMADDHHYVHRFHFDQPDGLLGMDDPVGAKLLRDRFDELWSGAEPAISATTLGL